MTASIITIHPTFAFFHQPYEAGTFVADVERFARVIRDKLEPYPTISPTPSMMTLAGILNCSEPVGVDIETSPVGERDENGEYINGHSGKDPTRCRLRTIGFGTTTRGCSMTWQELKDKPAALHMVRKFLANRRKLKVFHNGPWFDIRVLRRYGFAIHNWVDTRDLRRALVNTSRLSLRYLASICTDVHNWKDEEKGESKDGKGVIFTRDLKKLKKYNAWDSVLTARVFRTCMEDYAKVEPDYKPRVAKLYNVHRDLSITCARMHTRGINVRKDWRGFMLRCLDQEIEEKTEKFLKLVDVDGMRCTHNDMRGLLYAKHSSDRVRKFELPDPLDKDMYTTPEMETVSVDVNSLLLLIVSGEAPAEATPIIEAFWDVEELKKRRSTLSDELTDDGELRSFDKAIGPDGKLRPGWNSCGTDTMRLSCAEPNVMNWEQILRHAVGPGPGKSWVHADKAQLELRVMEAVSGDTYLYNLIQSGDVYSKLACDWFQLDPKKFDPKGKLGNPDKARKDAEARKSTKIIYLGRQYRAGLKAVFAQALREDRRFTFERVRLLVAQFDKWFAGIVAYWQLELEKVQKLGYSEGRILFGRHYYPAMPEPSEVANKPIQRTAGEMMNLEMLELERKLKRYTKTGKLIIQLHDATDTECDEKEEKLVQEIVHEVHDKWYTIEGRKRYFPVEVKTARYSRNETWADL